MLPSEKLDSFFVVALYYYYLLLLLLILLQLDMTVYLILNKYFCISNVTETKFQLILE